MRALIFAAAIFAASPAQAQYTIQISGTGVHTGFYDFGKVDDVISNYGSNISWSTTIRLDSGTTYGSLAADYFGETLSSTLNGSPVDLFGPSPFSIASVTTTFGPPVVDVRTGNMPLGRPTNQGYIFGIIDFVLPATYSLDLISALSSYTGVLNQSRVGVGGADGVAYYMFNLTGVTISGSQPPMTAGPVPVTPVPEPYSWSLMIIGLGMVGAGIRRRQHRTAKAMA